MSTVNKARVVNSGLGLIVADAATMGLHWVYDVEKLDVMVAENKEANGLFHTPLSCPFYDAAQHPGCYTQGQQSPYGEQFIPVFNAVAGAPSGRVGESLVTGLTAWLKTYPGRLNGAAKAFKAAVDGGAVWPKTGGPDDQADAFSTAAAVTLVYAGKPERKQKVEEAVRVLQDGDIPVAVGTAMSTVLDAVLAGGKLSNALELAEKEAPADIKKHFACARQAVSEKQSLREFLGTLGALLTPKEKHGPYTGMAGRSCGYPFSFLGGLHILYEQARRSSFDGAFVDSVRTNVLAGGDNCGRVAAFAPVIAALDAPPADLVSKTKEAAAFKATLEKALQ